MLPFEHGEQLNAYLVLGAMLMNAQNDFKDPAVESLVADLRSQTRDFPPAAHVYLDFRALREYYLEGDTVVILLGDLDTTYVTLKVPAKLVGITSKVDIDTVQRHFASDLFNFEIAVNLRSDGIRHQTITLSKPVKGAYFGVLAFYRFKSPTTIWGIGTHMSANRSFRLTQAVVEGFTFMIVGHNRDKVGFLQFLEGSSFMQTMTSFGLQHGFKAQPHYYHRWCDWNETVFRNVAAKLGFELSDAAITILSSIYSHFGGVVTFDHDSVDEVFYQKGIDPTGRQKIWKLIEKRLVETRVLVKHKIGQDIFYVPRFPSL